MDLLERMNRAIDYIEAHLTEKMDYERAARAACCSVYQFQRMFSFITDIPLSEYIRRRRMTLAAFELQNKECKVIDLALKYGYESPEAFTRAFQAVHDITPTQARNSGSGLKAYPRIAFQITIKGVATMNYRIEKKEARTVYGIERIFDTKDGQNYKDVPEFWCEAMKDGSIDKLIQSAGVDPKSQTPDSFQGKCMVNALCGYRETGGTTFPYMLFTEKTPVCNIEGYTTAEIPAATWAVFQSEEYDDENVKEVCQSLYRRIYSEWLPTSNYKEISGYDQEIYFATASKKSYLEIWIRVEAK